MWVAYPAPLNSLTAFSSSIRQTVAERSDWLALGVTAQDKYTVKVPGGLAFPEFRSDEGWQAISISRNENVVAMILGNPYPSRGRAGAQALLLCFLDATSRGD